MLQSVAGELGRAGALVSFNGKSFDAPVLETRYRLQPDGVAMRGPAARRRAAPGAAVLGNTDESCSLIALERQVLGVIADRRRPGVRDSGPLFSVRQIGRPAAAGGGLRAQPAGPAVAGRAHRAAAPSGRRRAVEDAGCARGAWRWARDLRPSRARSSRRRRTGVSAPIEGRALSGTGGRQARATAGIAVSVKVEALRSLALAARRARQFEAAAERWQQLLELPGCPRSVLREASEALAIHHEHRARDLAAARCLR